MLFHHSNRWHRVTHVEGAVLTITKHLCILRPNTKKSNKECGRTGMILNTQQVFVHDTPSSQPGCTVHVPGATVIVTNWCLQKKEKPAVPVSCWI